MRRFAFFKILNIVLCVIAAVALFGFVVMHLWNWLMPALFGLKTITLLQAFGLLLLSKLLFGGIHRHGGGYGGPRGWKRRMRERFANMTPEEMERFRAGMRGRRCGFGPGWRAPGREPGSEPERSAV